MTEISITPEVYSDRTIEMVHTGEDTRLSITTVLGTDGIDSFLGYGEAHRLADWIKKNVPIATPKPTLREQFDALPVGTVFTKGSKVYHAVKLSATSIFLDGDVRPVNTWLYDDEQGTLEVIPVD